MTNRENAGALALTLVVQTRTPLREQLLDGIYEAVDDLAQVVNGLITIEVPGVAGGQADCSSRGPTGGWAAGQAGHHPGVQLIIVRATCWL
jgi:hypothetical protein